MNTKKLFFFAIAALGLAACSNDEVVQTNATSEANEISFRTQVSGVTRAVDITTANLTAFNVTAYPTGTATTEYIPNVTFTKDGNTFNSANKYYWPASNLDFYAYAPIDGATATLATTGASGNQITRTAYNAFTVIPSSSFASQADLVFAKSVNQGKQTNGGEAGAAVLNFRHAGAKIVLKLKNSEPNLKFEVSAFKFVNLDGSATFTCADANTDGQNTNEAVSGTTLASSDWSNNTEASEKIIAYSTGDFTAANVIPASQTTAMYLNHTSNSPSTSVADEDINMILIPQTTSAATAYSATTQYAPVNTGNGTGAGTYIAVKMVIKNNADGTVIANANVDDVNNTGHTNWAMWPVAFNWVPGKKYVYTIDLADCGYWETNTNDGDSDFDPIVSGAVIKFVNVTVDEWDAVENNVSHIAIDRTASYAFENSSAKTINLPNGANGGYTFTITGLTEGETVTAAATNNFTASPTISGAADATGKLTISGVLTANTSAAVTSVITISRTTPSESMTISIVQAAE